MKYVVEHLDDCFERWTILEYTHICERVKEENVIFTLFPEGKTLSIDPTCAPPTYYTESLTKLPFIQDSAFACLLDMKATQPLTPEDSKLFNFFVFGGILGNVPCEDRTSKIRCFNPSQKRHLGSMQMSTDTAVLVTKIVMEDKLPLENIPYVDYPEIPFVNLTLNCLRPHNAQSSVELPFRYVSLSYFTKKSQDLNIPVLPKGMKEFLEESQNDCFN